MNCGIFTLFLSINFRYNIIDWNEYYDFLSSLHAKKVIKTTFFTMVGE